MSAASAKMVNIEYCPVQMRQAAKMEAVPLKNANLVNSFVSMKTHSGYDETGINVTVRPCNGLENAERIKSMCLEVPVQILFVGCIGQYAAEYGR